MLCCAYIYDLIVVELQSSADVGNLISNNIIAGSQGIRQLGQAFRSSIV